MAVPARFAAEELRFQEEISLLYVDASGRVAGASESAAAWAEGRPLVGRSKADVLSELSQRRPFICYPLPLYGPKHLGTALLLIPPGRTLDQAVAAKLDQELQAVMESTVDEVHITDGHGTTVRISNRCEEFFGISPHEMLGMPLEAMERRGLANPMVARLVMEKRRRVTTVQETVTGRRLIVTGQPVFGANDVLTRIVITSRDITALDRLTDALEETRSRLRAYEEELNQLRRQQGEKPLLFRTKAMEHLVGLAQRVAQVDCTTLIQGETGVGKEVLARSIHQWSHRRGKPFVAVNCGAIPEPLLESELFGYVAGAFTGAQKEGKVGLIEAADGGTLFLDEIGDMPLALQVKLLRVIQQPEVTRLGSAKPVKVDVRFIAATNRNLYEMAREGRFRQDLFYRLNVVPLTIPPLRERPEDVLALANHFLEVFGRRYGMEKRLSPAAADALTAYPWPGNVRELENTMERLVVTVEDGTLLPDHLPADIGRCIGQAGDPPLVSVHQLMPLKQAVRALEAELIRKAYSQFGSSYRVAKALGVHQSTVVRKLQRLGLNIPGDAFLKTSMQ